MFDDKANFAIHANFCERDLVWTFFPSLAEALRTTQRVDVPVRIILQDGQDRIRIGQDKNNIFILSHLALSCLSCKIKLTGTATLCVFSASPRLCVEKVTQLLL